MMNEQPRCIKECRFFFTLISDEFPPGIMDFKYARRTQSCKEHLHYCGILIPVDTHTSFASVDIWTWLFLLNGMGKYGITIMLVVTESGHLAVARISDNEQKELQTRIISVKHVPYGD